MGVMKYCDTNVLMYIYLNNMQQIEYQSQPKLTKLENDGQFAKCQV